ncbi:helix-turn-helix transcriptional regulator [Aquibacillus rhizosphaerae]|uniref:Helix-turn-helix transcriptional regulator n=1 Tax=Aquibacillus rhizosphaerae TaxID=3051431 RepID=A0ABT7LC82_9BACI|nr:helix-turn-helix transcriptional regulator [Aquibacillus sp. LR5S19]MDL4842795.1 helix-turn-helix transcriptional regulator [Aquibacillus sp. LR5S19]
MKNNRLLEARKNKELTQEQFAKILGYKGRQSIANWENGHSVPPLSVAFKVADILESDVGFLFGIRVQNTHTKSKEAI